MVALVVVAGFFIAAKKSSMSADVISPNRRSPKKPTSGDPGSLRSQYVLRIDTGQTSHSHHASER
jgi:hypothetical protein